MAGRGEREAETLVTWRSAVTQAVLTAVFPVFGYLDFPSTGRPVFLSRVVCIGWALALLAILVRQRKRPSLTFSRIAFGLAPIPLLPMFWLLAHERSLRILPLELFFRENLASVLCAVATPPAAAISLVVIAAITAQNFIVYYFGAIPLAADTTRLEPWTSLLIGVFAVGLALYRAHRQRAEVGLIVARERATALERMTRSFLAARDLANTPLQTLELSLSLLKGRYPQAQDLTTKMERSLMRLRELNLVLDIKASEVEWKTGDESFDAMSVLRKPDEP
jgi:hypothetical protein